MSEESFVYTACPGWGDHDYCAIKTIVKDGKIVRTERVVYSDPEEPDGHICQKGILSCRQPYNPKRLVAPLKRVGARGEGKWETISWDQALDEIGQKLVDIKKTYGSQSLAIWTLTAGVPPSSGLNTLLAHRFFGLYGATDPVNGMGLDNGPFFANYYTFGDGLTYILYDPRNFIGSDYFIVWGSNPIENQMRGAQNIVRAREAGAHIVDIGLVFDGTAGFADEFVGVAAGSDTWLALAMCHALIKEGLIDKDFLINHSVAPFLVDTSTGTFLRHESGYYLVWDEAVGKEYPVAPNGTVDATMPTLEGSYIVDGTKVKTAYQMLVEFLEGYTPEAAEKITRVPAADIIRLAIEYGTAKNAFIMSALGMRYVNQGSTYRAIQILGILTGNIGRKGAGLLLCSQFCSYPIAFNDGPIVLPDGLEASKGQPMMMEEFFAKASSDKSPFKGFFCACGNPVHQQPDRKRWIKIFDQMELVVDIDIWLTDTGELADYVLPDCMPFERLEILNAAQYNHVVLQEPAIEPPVGVKDPTFIWSEIAKRVGLGDYFDKTAEEWLAIRLDTDYPPIATLEPTLTWERLKTEKMVRVNAPEDPKFDPFASLEFPTPSGKAEFYSERLADIGFALPAYTPCFESPVIDGNDTYPYQLFTGRQRFFMQSMFTDDPINVTLSGGVPATRMNPTDAVAKGLRDGDKVEVFNQRGHVVTALELDESVPQGTLHVWFGWRRRQFEEGTYAEMVTPICAPGVSDAQSNRWLENWRAGGGVIYAPLDIMSYEVGSWDAYWDVACDIRKYEAVAAGKEA